MGASGGNARTWVAPQAADVGAMRRRPRHEACSQPGPLPMKANLPGRRSPCDLACTCRLLLLQGNTLKDDTQLISGQTFDIGLLNVLGTPSGWRPPLLHCERRAEQLVCCQPC